MAQGNHTSIWNIERRLAHIQGTRLPVQPTLTAVGVWLAAQVIWAILWLIVVGSVGFATAAYLLGPPLLIGWAVERIRLDDRPILTHLAAIIRHRFQPDLLCRLAPHEGDATHAIKGSLWTADAGRTTDE